MKTIVHIGMPKAGSTSIQWALRRHSQELMQNHGIFYAAQAGELNDWHIYNYLVSPDRAEHLDRYVDEKLNEGSKCGAKYVVFSAERLFMLPDIASQLPVLLNNLKQKGAESEVVIVVRGLRDFMNSYIKQLIANGGAALGNEYLATWLVRQLRSAVNLPVDVKIISFDLASQERKLISAFISAIIGRDVTMAESRENVSSSRPFSFISMLGQAARLRSALIRKDINSPEVDAYRVSVEERYDDFVRSKGEDFYRFLNEADEFLVQEIAHYCSESLSFVDSEDLLFYDEICAASLTVFEKRLF